VGGTRELSASAETADSIPIPEARFHWEMADTGIIAYDPAKRLLTAKGPGTTTLTARLKGFEPAVWTIQVIQGLIGLERPRVGLVVGERVNLSAVMLDDSGRAVGPAPDLQWSTDRAEIATVAAGGAVAGVSPGRAVVTAKAPWGKSATGEVFVVGDLLISSNRGGGFGVYQIRLGVPDGFLPVLLESGAAIQAVRSPDRTRIAFSTNRHGSYDLYVMDADGRNPRRLTTDPGNEGEPAWTPDGARILYVATPRTGPAQIYSIRADGGDGRALTTSTGGNSSPTVSPDGRNVAFVSARDGNQEIYLMAPDGSGQRRLTRNSVRESNPRFLPGGDIVYVAERGRSKGSWVLRLAPGAAQGTQILETNQAIASMDVSRDGERVAYVIGRLTDASKRKTEFRLIVQKLSPGSTPGSVPLRPNEQVVSPSF
ncbi:MAG: TolB family protein, partial [Gemmatimonadales bacterium]